VDYSLRPELGAVQRLELRLSPAMIQSMEILQLPSLDLQERIEAELEENPVLEVAEPESAASVEGEAGPGEGGAPDAAAPERPEAAGEGEFSKIEDLSASTLPEWDDDEYVGRRAGARAGEDDPKLGAMQNVESRPMTLGEHLEGQLAFVSDDARAVALAREVIGNLDDNGYLMGSLAEIAGSLEAWTPPPSAEELEAALSLVQSLDPPGVGARDLRECLLLQLARERPAPTPELRLAREIIMRYLDELGRNSLPQIVKEVRRTAPELGAIDVDDVKNAHRIIASLDPKPGRTFGGTRPKYIRPDVIIEKIDGRYEVRLENGYFPRLTLKNEYRALMTGGRSDSETRKFLRRKFQDAEFLLKALSMRDHTLQRIAGEIAALQEGFFEKGVEHLRPLRLQDVAERLGIHLSTVSRAISGKYLQCPRGVFEMKFFFPGGASRQDGTSESRNSVMARLKDLIAKEDRSRPLSDEDLAVELKKQGIAISRRTVTKYREAEGIAASRERKVY
jgi:RNA polymerase sigma-54 factor